MRTFKLLLITFVLAAFGISFTYAQTVDEIAIDFNLLLQNTNSNLGLYIKVTDSCNHAWYSETGCLNARSGPGTEYPVVDRLRNDVVLRVDQMKKSNGRNWYRAYFNDQKLYYPERAQEERWIAGDFVELFTSIKPMTTWQDGGYISNKMITVDISDQTLIATEGDQVFMQTDVSTGEDYSPTTIGEFEVFKMMPSRYMQGPIPGSGDDDEYDLAGVPWNLYFTADGEVIHGAYWHNNFGTRESHGCVNLRPDQAERLFEWTHLGTKVIIKE